MAITFYAEAEIQCDSGFCSAYLDVEISELKKVLQPRKQLVRLAKLKALKQGWENVGLDWYCPTCAKARRTGDG